jgi:hypothetical protein
VGEFGWPSGLRREVESASRTEQTAVLLERRLLALLHQLPTSLTYTVQSSKNAPFFCLLNLGFVRPSKIVIIGVLSYR